MPDLYHIQAEIQFMRVQVGRQQKEILQIHRARISSAAAEVVFESILANIERLCELRGQFRRSCRSTIDRASTTAFGGAKRSFRQALMIAELSARLL
jgi:hypothetical protein